MLAQDIAELNRAAVALFDDQLAGIPLFVTDVDDGDPDENAIYCRFAVNPDMSDLTTVGQNNRYLQEGSAVLQIMQPRNLVLTAKEKTAWEIADIATKTFRMFEGADGRIHIQTVVSQRVPDDHFLQVNLLIFFKSQHI